MGLTLVADASYRTFVAVLIICFEIREIVHKESGQTANSAYY
jgi:hypothetical protein